MRMRKGSREEGQHYEKWHRWHNWYDDTAERAASEPMVTWKAQPPRTTGWLQGARGAQKAFWRRLAPKGTLKDRVASIRLFKNKLLLGFLFISFLPFLRSTGLQHPQMLGTQDKHDDHARK